MSSQLKYINRVGRQLGRREKPPLQPYMGKTQTKIFIDIQGPPPIKTLYSETVEKRKNSGWMSSKAMSPANTITSLNKPIVLKYAS